MWAYVCVFVELNGYLSPGIPPYDKAFTWGHPLCTIASTLFLVASSIASTNSMITLASHKHLCELQNAAALNLVTLCQTQAWSNLTTGHH